MEVLCNMNDNDLKYSEQTVFPSPAFACSSTRNFEGLKKTTISSLEKEQIRKTVQHLNIFWVLGISEYLWK